MKNLIQSLKRKANRLILGLAINGAILVLLAILIVWTDFMLKLVIGLLVLVIAFAFFQGAWKIYSIKKELEKFFKL